MPASCLTCAPRRAPTPRATLLLLAFAALFAPALLASHAEATEQGARVADQLRRRVERSFHARTRLAELWPDDVWQSYRAKVHEAPDPDADLAVLNELLARLGASHTELLPKDIYEQQYGPESRGESGRQVGLELAVRASGDSPAYFVAEVFPGSPAWLAGLRRGDEVLLVDGAPPAASARLCPFGDRGVPVAPHFLVRGDAAVTLSIRSRPTERPVDVQIEPAPFGRVEASRQSVRTFRRAGKTIGYVRLYHVLRPEIGADLEAALRGPLAHVDGLVLDLRGWGGQVGVLQRILRMLPGAARPVFDRAVVALVDERTRSAKEIGAFFLKERGIPLVGRPTPGAVLGCQFFDIGEHHVLMLPVVDVRSLSRGQQLEGAGVAPDIHIADDLPYAAGHDAVLEAGVHELLRQVDALLVPELF